MRWRGEGISGWIRENRFAKLHQRMRVDVAFTLQSGRRTLPIEDDQQPPPPVKGSGTKPSILLL